MATFRNRFPNRHQLISVFLASAFASNAWALYNITQEIPAWILRLSMSEMLGVIAHNLYLALLDALPIFLVLTLLSAILPAAWLKNRFTAIGTALAMVTAVWFIFLHVNGFIGTRNTTALLLWGVSYLVATFLIYFYILRSDKANQALTTFAERLALLAGIYIVVDILSVIVVLVRSIWGTIS